MPHYTSTCCSYNKYNRYLLGKVYERSREKIFNTLATGSIVSKTRKNVKSIQSLRTFPCDDHINLYTLTEQCAKQIPYNF